MQRGNEDQSCKKHDFPTKFEELDTEIRTCFPIHVVVLMPLNVSAETQIVSKSINSGV